MKKVKVCLIGSGRAGMIHARNMAGSVPGGEIYATCDPDISAAKAAAEELGIETYYQDYTEALSDEQIDAVIIACPTKYHREIAVAAANEGKHISVKSLWR